MDEPPPARFKVYRVLPCPYCGRQYAATEFDRLAVMCCGHHQPLAVVVFPIVAPQAERNQSNEGTRNTNRSDALW